MSGRPALGLIFASCLSSMQKVKHQTDVTVGSGLRITISKLNTKQLRPVRWPCAKVAPSVAQ